MLVYTGVNVGTGGETIALGMFFTVGVVFNGVQILLRAIEVVA